MAIDKTKGEIAIYGTLKNDTTSGVIAYASQIKDEDQGFTQDVINMLLNTKINDRTFGKIFRIDIDKCLDFPNNDEPSESEIVDAFRVINVPDKVVISNDGLNSLNDPDSPAEYPISLVTPDGRNIYWDINRVGDGMERIITFVWIKVYANDRTSINKITIRNNGQDEFNRIGRTVSTPINEGFDFDTWLAEDYGGFKIKVESDISKNATSIDTLQTANSTLTTRINTAEENITKNASDIDDLKSDLSDINTELESKPNVEDLSNVLAEGILNVVDFNPPEGVTLDELEAAVRPKVINCTETTKTIKPNNLYIWGQVDELNIELEEPTHPEVINEYMIDFSSGDTPTVLTLPESVKFVIPLKMEPNCHYQISILNNIGLIAQV